MAILSRVRRFLISRSSTDYWPAAQPSRTFIHHITANHLGSVDLNRTTVVLGCPWAHAQLSYLVDLDNVVVFQGSHLIGRATLNRGDTAGKSHSNRTHP